MGTEPVRERLTQGGLGVRVGTRPHDRDKHLGLRHYSGFGVGQGYCLSAEYDNS